MNILRDWLRDSAPGWTTSQFDETLTLRGLLETAGAAFPEFAGEALRAVLDDLSTGPLLQSAFLEVLGPYEWDEAQSRAIDSRFGPPARWVTTIETVDSGAVTLPDDASPEPYLSLFVRSDVGTG